MTALLTEIIAEYSEKARATRELSLDDKPRLLEELKHAADMEAISLQAKTALSELEARKLAR